MTVDVQSSVVDAARTAPLPGGGEGRVLDDAAVASIARNFNVRGHAVESAALAEGIRPVRYLRNGAVISVEQQRFLLDASIALVGLGGLGGHVLDMSLRLGVGVIDAVDGDHFEPTNLNRQLLSNQQTLNMDKAQAARTHAENVNPSVAFTAEPIFLHGDGFIPLLEGKTLVVDALGGLDDRLSLRQAAQKVGIPIVSGALAGWTGYVATTYPGDPSPSDFMGDDNGAEEKLGCPAPAVSLVASLMASHITDILTRRSEPSGSSMLLVDLLHNSFEPVTL